jgi:hypothetical protein
MTTECSEGDDLLFFETVIKYVQLLTLNYKIIRHLYLLSEVLPHPLTRSSSPASSPAISRSLMGLI